jgi:hypothetical protein
LSTKSSAVCSCDGVAGGELSRPGGEALPNLFGIRASSEHVQCRLRVRTVEYTDWIGISPMLHDATRRPHSVSEDESAKIFAFSLHLGRPKALPIMIGIRPLKLYLIC